MEELKNKILWLLVIALLVFAFKLNAQDKNAYNLQMCIDLALQNNYALTVSQTQLESGKARLQQTEAAALPYVSGYANQGINAGKSINPYTNQFVTQEIGTGQYGLSAGMTLFSGLYTVHSIQQSANSHQADKMDYAQARLDITIQVTQAYLQILTNEELLNQANFQMQLTQAQLDRLTVLDKNNAVSPSVLYDTKGQLANDKINLVTTRTALQTARITLAQLINTKISPDASFEKIETEKELAEPLMTFDNLYPELQPKAPSLRSADYRQKSVLKNLRASQGLVFPTLSLNGSIGSNYSSAALSQKIIGISNLENGSFVSVGGNDYSVYQPQANYDVQKIPFNNQLKNNFNRYIGLSLQVPIFNGLKTRTQIKLAKINYHQAQEQVKTVEIRFRSLIEQTCNELASAYERHKIYTEQVEDYSNSFNIAKIKFEQGSINSVDYMVTKNNFERAKIGLINTRYEYVLKKKVLGYYKELQ